MAIQFSCKYATWRPFNRPRHCRALQSCSFGHIAFHARSRFRLSVTNYACLVFPRYSYVGTRSCSHTVSLSLSLPPCLSLFLCHRRTHTGTANCKFASFCRILRPKAVCRVKEISVDAMLDPIVSPFVSQIVPRFALRRRNRV